MKYIQFSGLLVMLLTLTTTIRGQLPLPEVFDMSSGASYIMDKQPQGAKTYPKNMVIRFCTVCNQKGNFTDDLTAEADHHEGGGAGKWRGEGNDGVSVRGGTDMTRASFLVRLNSTGRSNIAVGWTVRDIVSNVNTNCLELQWRVGGSGSWNNVGGDLYCQGAQSSGSSYQVTLPDLAANQSDLRVRWIYYETGSGARDRLALDDILITSASSSDVVLPLRVRDFQLEKDNQGIRLTWFATNLEEIEFFEVEESRDGMHFEKIERVPNFTSGNSEQFTSYRSDLLQGRYYYRIAQVDLDGMIHYTPVKTLEFHLETTMITVFPTIATDELMIIGADGDRIKIVNSDGQICYSGARNSSNVIDISGLLPGIYFVVVESGTSKSSFTIMKA